MVALAEWIESEETAVAAPSSRPGDPLPAAENRVWDFFGRTPDRVGESASQVADRVWVIELRIYDSRRSPSLPRRGESEASVLGLVQTAPAIKEGIALTVVIHGVLVQQVLASDLALNRGEAGVSGKFVQSRPLTPAEIEQRKNEVPLVLFHYTSQQGLAGILASQQINPSLKAANPSDARYGNGQYFSDIVPGTKTPAQLSRQFINNPFQGDRYNHFLQINVQGLPVIRGRDGVYVVPNEGPLDVSKRIMLFGPVPDPEG